MFQLVCAAFLLPSLAFAHDLQSILVELNLREGDVIVSEDKVSAGEGSPETTQFSVILKKPAKFRANSLAKGAHLIFDSSVGLVTLMTEGSTLTFQGIKCLGNVEFLDNELCSCKLAKPLEVTNSVTLPIGAIIKFSQGKVTMFKLPKDDPRTPQREDANFPNSIGAVKISFGDVYSIEQGKVSKRENAPEGFCF